jgi:hypothetical protein
MWEILLLLWYGMHAPHILRCWQLAEHLYMIILHFSNIYHAKNIINNFITKKKYKQQMLWLFLVNDSQQRWSDTVHYLFCVHGPLLWYFYLMIKCQYVIPRSVVPTCVHIWPCSTPFALFMFLKIAEPCNWFHCYNCNVTSLYSSSLLEG